MEIIQKKTYPRILQLLTELVDALSSTEFRDFK